MASLELRNQTYRVVFMYAGKKYGYSLDTGKPDVAAALRGGVEKTLMLIGQGALRVPDGGMSSTSSRMAVGSRSRLPRPRSGSASLPSATPTSPSTLGERWRGTPLRR